MADVGKFFKETFTNTFAKLMAKHGPGTYGRKDTKGK